MAFMRRVAQRDIDDGVDPETATADAVETWRLSLLRSQLITAYHAELRRQGKPTLHVSLFEAAKIR